MLKLNLQAFAKSASAAREYRKKRAISKYAEEAKSKPAEEKKTPPPQKQRGEAVSAVNMKEEYEFFVMKNGKEYRAVINGQQVVRTGKQILDKMYYDKENHVWRSRANSTNKYILRRK